MPIISLCLDDRQRKFFVGDALGGITCHNYLNGVEMKRFEAHTSQVRGLVGHRETKRFEARNNGTIPTLVSTSNCAVSHVCDVSVAR